MSSHPRPGKPRPSGLILGIESSCDETAAAVVSSGRLVLSSVVASQFSTHAPYGGVVPELASREHLRNLVPVVQQAMQAAAVDFQDLDAIAVTEGPGLAGALLVGVTYAKTLAWALGKPLIAVNHLEGHIHAVLLEHAQNPAALLPAIALVVSGGHTHLYLADCQADSAAAPHADPDAHPGADGYTTPTSGGSDTGTDTRQAWHYRTVGRTVDDAAGEAFDKVAKLLGLGYPGGPWLDALAPHGNPQAVPFRFADVRPRPNKQRSPSPSAPDPTAPNPAAPSPTASNPAAMDPAAPNSAAANPAALDPALLFSFSGIKTAVLRYVETHAMAVAIAARAHALSQLAAPTLADALALCDPQTLDLIASFQHAVVGTLIERTLRAARLYNAQTVLVSGGVAANRELRTRFPAATPLPVLFPSPRLSTDNAAMIAAAAWPRLQHGHIAPPAIAATPRLRLGPPD